MILSIADGKIERVTTSDFVGMYTYESAEKMPQIVRDAMLKTGRLHPDFPVQVALHGFNHLDSSDGYFLPGKTDGICGGTNTHVLSNTTLLIEGIWGGDASAIPTMCREYIGAKASTTPEGFSRAVFSEDNWPRTRS